MPFIRERFLNEWVGGHLSDAEIREQLAFFDLEIAPASGVLRQKAHATATTAAAISLSVAAYSAVATCTAFAVVGRSAASTAAGTSAARTAAGIVEQRYIFRCRCVFRD
jgi:hypothetical protein